MMIEERFQLEAHHLSLNSSLQTRHLAIRSEKSPHVGALHIFRFGSLSIAGRAPTKKSTKKKGQTLPPTARRSVQTSCPSRAAARQHGHAAAQPPSRTAARPHGRTAVRQRVSTAAGPRSREKVTRALMRLELANSASATCQLQLLMSIPSGINAGWSGKVHQLCFSGPEIFRCIL
jgi:hypothetical protein